MFQIDANHLDGESIVNVLWFKTTWKVKIDQPEVCNYYV